MCDQCHFEEPRTDSAGQNLVLHWLSLAPANTAHVLSLTALLPMVADKVRLQAFYGEDKEEGDEEEEEGEEDFGIARVADSDDSSDVSEEDREAEDEVMELPGAMTAPPPPPPPPPAPPAPESPLSSRASSAASSRSSSRSSSRESSPASSLPPSDDDDDDGDGDGDDEPEEARIAEVPADFPVQEVRILWFLCDTCFLSSFSSTLTHALTPCAPFPADSSPFQAECAAGRCLCRLGRQGPSAQHASRARRRIPQGQQQTGT
jgi:hypothetical protein